MYDVENHCSFNKVILMFFTKIVQKSKYLRILLVNQVPNWRLALKQSLLFLIILGWDV